MNSDRLLFWDHVEQLRRALVRALLVILSGFLVAFIFHRPLIALLCSHVDDLILLGPLDGLSASLKVSVWTAVTLTAPVWGYLLLSFVGPALSARHRQALFPFLASSILFVALGLSLAYGVTIPLANRMLYQFNAALATNSWTLTSYLSYTVILALGHAVAFEAMVILLFLVHAGTITTAMLCHGRRPAIIITLSLAAILTPPDVLTQCLLALPMLLMYEGAILYSKFQVRGTQTRSS